MKKNKYDVFISYRREGGFETANLIASKLKLSGYRVFLDIHSMHSGDFAEQIKEKVKGCKDFIWVLSPTIIKNDDGTVSSTDTLYYREGIDYYRDEICWAIEYHKNIIPIILDGFKLPASLPNELNEAINKYQPQLDLSLLQSVIASKNLYFDASIQELKKYLISYAIIKWRIIFGIVFTLLASVFIAVAISQSSNSYNEYESLANRTDSQLDGLLSNQVQISARLMDTVFIKTDSVISKTIDYDAYMGINRDEDGTIELGPFYDFFHYVDTCVDGIHSILPNGLYVGDYYLHDSITILDGGFLSLGEDEYTNMHYPVLDVSLVNNSQQTILVDELLIEVEDSRVDSRPFVIVTESEGVLTIENRGWKSWRNALFRFSLLPDGYAFDGKYKFEIPIPSSSEEIVIPMYNYFVKSGIDFTKICTSSIVTKGKEGEIPYWESCSSLQSAAALDTLRKLLYPVKIEIGNIYTWDDEDGTGTEITYIDPYLVLHGELIFDNTYSLKVGGTVRFLTSEGYGAPYLECSRLFDVKFKDNGEDYVIKYPVSHYLKAGDVDRIVIQMNADKTSYHTFRVRLHNVNQVDIKTEPINLLIFKYKDYITNIPLKRTLRQ